MTIEYRFTPVVIKDAGWRRVVRFLLEPPRCNTSSSVVAMIFGQATKGVRWMPWHEKAMKDVISCDKPRGGANNL